jgi:ubiquinone biosynthesis protein
MHPGSLFLDDASPAGRGRLRHHGAKTGLKERRFLAEILLGFITRDYRRVAEVAFRGRLRAGASSVENFARKRSAPSAGRSTTRTTEEVSMASC